MKNYFLHHTLLWSLILCCLLPAVGQTQSAEPCVDYQRILENLAKAEARKEFGEALQQLSALRACAPEQTDVIDAGYERVFKAIGNLNEEFKSARDRAKQEESRALRALAEAKKQRLAADDARAAAEEQARNVFLNELDNQLKEEADSLLAMNIASFAYHYVDSLHPVVLRTVTESYYKYFKDRETERGLNNELKWIEESPNGQLTAVANASGEIIVVRNDTCILVDYRPLIGKGEPIDLAWSADSRGLAVTTNIGYVAAWHLGEEEVLFEVEMEYPLLSIDEAPQGNLWAVGSLQGLLYLIDQDGSVQRYNAHSYSVSELGFSPDGKRLATVSYSGIAKIWTLGNMSNPLELKAHYDYIRDMNWSPDGQYLFTVGDDEQAILWNTSSAEVEWAMNTESNAYLFSSAWNPANNLIAIGDVDGKTVIWEVGDTSRRYEIESLPGSIISLQWTNHDSLLQILGNESIKPLYWSLATQDFVEAPQSALFELLQLTNETDQWTVSWHPRGQQLAAGYQDGSVWVWEDLNQLPRSLAVNHDNGIWELAYSPDGSILAVVSPGYISLYQVDDHYRLREAFGTRASHVCLAWHPNGNDLLLGDTEGNVTVYDIGAYNFVSEEPWSIHTQQVRSLDFTPDGNYFLTASQDSTAVIFNYTKGVIHAVIKGVHNDVLRDAVWSPDGKSFATGGDDQQVYIYKFDNPNNPTPTLSRHQSRVLSLDWSIDGRIASVSDRELFFWDGSSGDSLSTALYDNIDRSDQISFRSDGTLALAANTISPVLVDAAGRARRLPGPSNPVTPLRQQFEMMDSEDQLDQSAFERGLRSYSPNQVFYNRDGSLMALQSTAYEVLVFNGYNGNRISQIERGVEISDLAWSPIENKLVISYKSKDKSAYLYDFSSPPYSPKPLIGHKDWVRFVDWSPDGQQFVTGSDDNRVIIWRASDGAKLNEYSPATQVFLMDGYWLKNDRIAIKDQPGAVFLLKMKEEQGLFSILEENASDIRPTADRDYIMATLSGDRPVILAFDSKNGTNIPLGNSTSDPRVVSYIPALESWITSFGDSRFNLLDLDQKITLMGDLGSGKILGIIPSPAQSYVALITDRELVIWDWKIERDVFRFPVEELKPSDLRWSPDGKFILYRDGRETALRLLDPIELLRRAEGELLGKIVQKDIIYDYNLSRLLPNDVTAWYPLFSKRQKGPQLEVWGSWLAQQAKESVEFKPALFREAIRFYESLKDDRNLNASNGDLIPLYIEFGKRWLQAGQIDSARQMMTLASNHPDYDIALLDLKLPYYLQSRQTDKALESAALIRTQHPKPDVFIRDLRRGVNKGESLALRTQVFRVLNFDQVTKEDVRVFNILSPPYATSMDALIAKLPVELQEAYRLSQEVNRLKNDDLPLDVFWKEYQALWEKLNGPDQEATNLAVLTDVAGRFIGQLSRMKPQQTFTYQDLILAKLPPLSVDLKAAISRVSQLRFDEISESKDLETALAAGKSFIAHTTILKNDEDHKEYLARGLADLAWVEMKAGMMDSAYTHLQQAFAINDLKVLTLTRFGHYFLLSDNPERAMSFYQFIITERPESYENILKEVDQLPAGIGRPMHDQLVQAWELYDQQKGLLNRITAIQERYENVGDDPKTNYLYLEQLTKAESLYRDLLTKYEGVPLFVKGEFLDDSTMAVNLGNYSYYALFVEEFEVSRTAAEEAIALFPQNWMYTNFAHGFLYDGEWAEAKTMYETIRQMEDDSSDEQGSLRQALLQDFFDLNQAGVWHKDVPKAAELILERKLTKLEKDKYGRL